MEKHNGEIVEHAVRKNGYSLTDLARALLVNRRTIYNYFQNPYLKYDIIHKIGLTIRHDFSKEFPELFTGSEFIVKNMNGTTLPTRAEGTEGNLWKDKYISLLEDYNTLLKKYNLAIYNDDQQQQLVLQ